MALQHQMTIIECLDHPDLIIKREVGSAWCSETESQVLKTSQGFNGFPFVLQTLELLFRITNAQNVVVIVEKMLEFLQNSPDDYTTIDLVGKVAELAEKYPSLWCAYCQLYNDSYIIASQFLHGY